MAKLILYTADAKGGHHELEVGNVTEIPGRGDWVEREESGWQGFVSTRQWFVKKTGELECHIVLEPV